MKVLDEGHLYGLENLKSGGEQLLKFYKDPEINGSGQAGTSCQEVIRGLIDRVKFLDSQKPAEENEAILCNLRLALMGFEARAMRLAIEKGFEIEHLVTGPKGHIFG